MHKSKIFLQIFFDSIIIETKTYDKNTIIDIVNPIAKAVKAGAGWISTRTKAINPRRMEVKAANFASFIKRALMLYLVTSLLPKALVIITPGWFPISQRYVKTVSKSDHIY